MVVPYSYGPNGPNGNPETLIYPNGVVTTYTFDSQNRLESLVTEDHARQAGGKTITLFRMSNLGIRRHIKVRSEARYHDTRYTEYFKERWRQRRRREYQDNRRWAGHQQMELPLQAPHPEMPGRL